MPPGSAKQVNKDPAGVAVTIELVPDMMGPFADVAVLPYSASHADLKRLDRDKTTHQYSYKITHQLLQILGDGVMEPALVLQPITTHVLRMDGGSYNCVLSINASSRMSRRANTYPYHLSLGLLGLGALVDEVHEALEVDPAVVGEAHFARAAGGVAVGAALGVEVLQGVRGELGVAHAAVAGHAAARDARGRDLGGALGRHLHERGLDAHLLGGARHMDGDLLLLGLPLELVHQEVADELDGLIEAESVGWAPRGCSSPGTGTGWCR